MPLTGISTAPSRVQHLLGQWKSTVFLLLHPLSRDYDGLKGRNEKENVSRLDLLPWWQIASPEKRLNRRCCMNEPTDGRKKERMYFSARPHFRYWIKARPVQSFSCLGTKSRGALMLPRWYWCLLEEHGKVEKGAKKSSLASEWEFKVVFLTELHETEMKEGRMHYRK